MTVVSICSAKGSPGVSTLGCAIAATWPENRRIVLAECDPSGGDLAARFRLSAKRGMASLILASRGSNPPWSPELDQHLQRLPGGLEVLVGAVGASAARMLDDELAELVRWIRGLASDSDGQPPFDMLFDCGRIQPGALGQVAAMAASDHVLLVIPPTVEGVASAGWLAERLGRFGSVATSPSARPPAAARLVVVGAGPVKPREAAKALGLGIAGVVGPDRIGAAALRGQAVPRWRLSGCPLIRVAKDVARSLVPIREADSQDVDEPRPVDCQLASVEVGS
jgi:hypothetical protein